MSMMTVTMMSAAVSVLQPAVCVDVRPIEASSRKWPPAGRASLRQPQTESAMNSHVEIRRAREIVTRPETKMTKGLSFALCAVLSILICPLFLTAQDNASVTGKVQGTNGAALAGVKVTLVNQETQAKEETVTAEDGTFILSQLAQGNYLLQVEASGFETYQNQIQVGTDRPSSLKIKLKLRTVEEEVTVRPDTSDDRVSPESNSYSMKIDETFFTGLPLAIDYLLPFINTFTSPAAQGSEGTSIVVDGMDSGDLDMPATAIRSVKINRNPYSADFQHSGSARAVIH